MFDIERSLCADLDVSGTREWLVTNGMGAYACGTVAGVLTRRYHGLLIAALEPPSGRTLLLTKLDETVEYDGKAYELFANRWAGEHVEPKGYHYLEHFCLEGTIPVWTYSCADTVLEKRIWMQPGANITYIRYTMIRGACPLTLNLRAMVNYRDHHDITHGGGWRMQIEPVKHGLKITAYENAVPFYLLSDRAAAVTQHVWNRDYWLSVEDYRGFVAYEDHLYAGLFQIRLQAGESVTLVAGVESTPSLDSAHAYQERRLYEQELIDQSELTGEPQAIQHLVLAADQFIVRRSLPNGNEGHTVIAGYPWFSDWGRDTMTSLAGLTVATGRTSIARSILQTYAHFVDQGMLPNRFPDEEKLPDYNTVDATLWYIESIRAYYDKTGDVDFLEELFPVLQDIIQWHNRGTRYGIHVDSDGLLYAGQAGTQLTWMDAKVDDWVVTPRIGKPVEINALWYHNLCFMAEVAQILGKPSQEYVAAAEMAEKGFARFWNESKGYCYDVLDSPYGDDNTLRPNQLLAVSLPHSALTKDQQRAVVDVCARQLLIPTGLRTLAPNHLSYVGHYGGGVFHRDSAYHQGTAWAWLIGPFVHAYLRVHDDPDQAQSYLQPLLDQMASHGIGSISEIFDGDPPFTPRGCFAQAWSVAAVLCAWNTIKARRI